MALPAPELDDRHFQDLVDEAKRLIPRYCPEWTNHNLSDPGVALIELFAWMSEIVLYRLNQVPDRYYVRFLELVGIEPFPPSVARANLTFWLSAVLEHPVVVPAGVSVATEAGALEAEVVFSTLRDLSIAPPDLTAAATARAATPEQLTDALEELRYPGGVVGCFASEPMAPGDAFYVGFRSGLGGNIIQLQIEAHAEGIGVDPTNPPLVWEAWTGEAWVPVPVHLDTTGGLNRNGSIVLVMPLSHQPLTLAGTRAHWLRTRLLAAAPGQPEYAATPRVHSVKAQTLGGTVAAEHSESVGQESLGRSVATPGQTFALRRPPALERRDHEHVVVITDHGEDVWTEVDDFTNSTMDDHHVVWEGSTGIIRFGPSVRYANGETRQHGAIPPDGAEVLVTGYRQGGGAAGNVGARTLTRLRTTVPYIDRVENLVPSTGGVDAETVENAKVRGPMTIRTGQRAVTATDFERLTLEASTEVARARCLAPVVPGGPVRVLIVPEVVRTTAVHQLDDFAIAPDLLRVVSRELDERRVLGTSIEVATPYYQGITVAALVHAQSGRPANSVRERVLQALYRFINPVTGGAAGTGWPFDDDVNGAQVAQLLEGVEGVERVEEVLLFEVDLRTGERQGPARDLIRLDDNALFLSARHQVVVR
ncbi:MAG: hypothetical protein JWM47_1941 [Acidimicrobiales bacterium]|nr:hypothetical protein [Acidimicrobiales bacterium]